MTSGFNSRSFLPWSWGWACPLLAAQVPPPPARRRDYTIDPVHSKAQFDIAHLLISTVTGKFTKFQGDHPLDPSTWPSPAWRWPSTSPASTRAAHARDKDLRSPRFFDVAKYPTITFKSTSVTRPGPGRSAGGRNPRPCTG